MNTYKLYHTAAGYRCKVNMQELTFLFNIPPAADIETINELLKPFNYYVIDNFLMM